MHDQTDEQGGSNVALWETDLCNDEHSDKTRISKSVETNVSSKDADADVSVRLLHSMNLLPGQSSFALVKVDGEHLSRDPFLFECEEGLQWTTAIRVSDALVQVEDDNTARILVDNPSGFTQTLEQGTRLGSASSVTVNTPDVPLDCARALRISTESQDHCSDQVEWRKRALVGVLEAPDLADQYCWTS